MMEIFIRIMVVLTWMLLILAVILVVILAVILAVIVTATGDYVFALSLLVLSGVMTWTLVNKARSR